MERILGDKPMQLQILEFLDSSCDAGEDQTETSREALLLCSTRASVQERELFKHRSDIGHVKKLTV